ncbi:MAG: glycosyltransferase family 39 protein [Tannerella sp.]|jgi:4-amino-4-deoxy-L-arabinose transferase-like glycosyltransferase|nr:glycosyltransferase family 39 protein [Tannerella sp.]
MRTSAALQYLYLQKPVSSIIIICLIAVLPWIALGDFSTKGEPREAAVAVSMLESGDWILPKVYANEFAYKPPMMHWLITVFSLPKGEVTEFTSRLPSALAYTLMLVYVLIFFSRKTRFQEAFIATLLLLTCVEIHRAGMTARVDMLLTAFIVIGLIRLFNWEDKMELKGLPVTIPLILSAAALTKGPVGIVLPLFVFGVYLLTLKKYSLLKIIKSIVYIGVASSFIPSIWYIEALNQGGNDFFNVIVAENFGRFFHLNESNIQYDLGHENGAWYNLLTLVAGFIPWTLLLFFSLFFSLFGLKITKPDSPFRQWINQVWNRLLSMDKIKLFSLVASVCILFFYSIPSSKRSVYLMPAYPFIALFMAQYFIYLAEYRNRIFRIFAGTLFAVVSVVLIVIFIRLTGFVDFNYLTSRYLSGQSARDMVETIYNALSPGIIQILVYIFLCIAACTLFYQLRKKINIKILYATILLTFSINLFIDGVIMHEIRDTTSARHFANEIMKDYPLSKTNVFVMNDLKNYINMYGLNFYMGNSFRNFEIEKPSSGYFLCIAKDFQKIMQHFDSEYTFVLLRTSDKIMGDTRSKVVLSRFELNH